MSNRSWFFASNGQQQGPYPEAQFRDMIERGTVTGQTLVWSEGMTGWQKAAEVPGLVPGSAAPPAIQPMDGGVTRRGAYGALSLDMGIGEFIWRSIVFCIGVLLVIPGPWIIVWYTKWFVSRVQVPGRPNLSFTGNPLAIAGWYFGAVVIAIICAGIAYASESQAIGNLGYLVQIALYWLFLKYLVANLASNGQPLGLSFSGSFWGFLGYTLLTAIAFITVIGWAWVYAAQVRWICRNIQGTRRQVVFNGTGLEYLWRVIVVALLSILIIPIPWVVRWMINWQLSQTALVERGAGV